MKRIVHIIRQVQRPWIAVICVFVLWFDALLLPWDSVAHHLALLHQAWNTRQHVPDAIAYRMDGQFGMIWNDDPSVEVIPGEPIAYMYCLPRPDRAAFWAPTQAEYRTATAIQSWNPNVPLALDSDEVATICALYADLLAERLPSIPERYLNAIRNQTGGYVEVLPAGYVHNVLAAGVFLVLLISLTGIPRWEREARARYRMGKGLCPACRYDLRGKLDAGCSECGWNRPK